MAPYKTKAIDFDWRLNLKVGDIIDACDTSHVWYNCTVLDERTLYIDEDRPIKEILMGIFHDS